MSTLRKNNSWNDWSGCYCFYSVYFGTITCSSSLFI